jgi:cell division inhibitor SepF
LIQMAGLWQKTLFYLGLVDEDDPGYDTGQIDYGRQAVPTPEPAIPRPATPRPAAEGPRPQPQPQVRQRQPQPGGSETPARPAPGGGVAGSRRVDPPMAGRRRTVPESALNEAGVIVTPADLPTVRTVSERDLESEVITARSYSDAQLLADHIRSSIPVVLDLRKVEPAMVRRLVDFASGLTYALGGSMRKIGQGVILVTPANVNISRDERRRLEGLGFYQAPESS